MPTDLQQSQVDIPSGSVRLQGTLSLPKDATAVVLFAHGSGSSRFSPRNQRVAQAIHEAGVGTLLFDLLTDEEEETDRVSAEHRFNIELLAERLGDATDWVVAHSDPRGVTIGYFGASTGAAAALIAAAKFGDRIRAVVSRGGRADLAGAELSRVTAPTLLIVGELDEAVIVLNRQAYDQLRCEKGFVVVPGATHLFDEPGALEQVASLAATWFVRHLLADNPVVVARSSDPH
jgi:putative phosphoribosyl transferase